MNTVRMPSQSGRKSPQLGTANPSFPGSGQAPTAQTARARVVWRALLRPPPAGLPVQPLLHSRAPHNHSHGVCTCGGEQAHPLPCAGFFTLATPKHPLAINECVYRRIHSHT